MIVQKKYIKKYFVWSFSMITAICCVLFSTQVWAQDPHFSLNYAIPHQLNPALAGVYGYNLGLRHRSQWQDLNDGFVTSAASFDMPFKTANSGAGFGIAGVQDKAGGLNTTNGLVSLSYDAPLGGGVSGHHLRSGLQFMLTQKSLDFTGSNLLFADQYTGNGTFNNPSTDQVATFTSDMNYDANFGILWYKTDPAGLESKVQPYLGFTLYRINFSDEKGIGKAGDVSKRYLINGGMDFKSTGSKWHVKPAIIYMAQNNFSQMIIDFSVQKMSFETGSSKHSSFLVGGSYRMGDAAVLYTGMEIKSLKIGFAYDVIVSDISNVVSKGGFEVFLGYAINKSSGSTKKFDDSDSDESSPVVTPTMYPFPRF